MSEERPTTDPSRPPPAIFSLPNELLVAITAAGQEDRASWHVPDEELKSEWAMSHVSRHFREVIVGAPTLWTLVEIDVGSRYDELEGSMQILKLYLDRSRSSKLWATVHDMSRPGTEPELIAHRLSIIEPHIHRIWRLDLILTASSMETVLRFIPRNAAFPSLKHMEIEFYDIESPDPLDMFSSDAPPALTFLQIIGFIPNFRVPQWTASVTRLVLWRIHDLKYSKDISFFDTFTSEFPSLIHLSLDTTHLRRPQDMNRIFIPSLKYLHLLAPDTHTITPLSEIVGLFDTPGLTDLAIDCVHGDHVCALFDSTSLPDSSFPALTSLSFASKGLCGCEADPFIRLAQLIPSPPLRLFPSLSSLTLINVCFTAHIVEQILDPVSQPWPLLAALTVCPTEEILETVYNTLQIVIRSNRQHSQTIPKFRFSPTLFEQPYWEQNRVDVELFNPVDVIAGVGFVPE